MKKRDSKNLDGFANVWADVLTLNKQYSTTSDELVSRIVDSATPLVQPHLSTLNYSMLWQLSSAAGSSRHVVVLDNGWVAKVDEDGEQNEVELSMIELYGECEYLPRVVTNDYYQQGGVLFMEYVTPLDRYLESQGLFFHDELLTEGDGCDLRRENEKFNELHDYHRKVFRSLDLILKWCDGEMLNDTHMGNFGVRDDGSVVMLDLGYGSGV